MNLSSDRPAPQRRPSALLAVILLCITVNFLGDRLAAALRLPLFLDSMGTVFAAALCGYIPGIAVGFLSNLLSGIFDSSMIYYCSINVLLALASAFFAEKGFFRRLPGLLGVVAVLALIGGGIGSVLTWFLNGSTIGHSSSTFLQEALRPGAPSFLTQLSADLLMNLADKLLSVIPAALALRFLPQRLRELLAPERFSLSGRAQKTRGASLRLRIMALILAAGVVVTATITTICLVLYHDAVMDEASTMAYSVARTTASIFDADRVEDYMEQGDAMEGYAELEQRIANIAASSPDIQYIYVYRILEDGCHVVIDPDTPDDPSTPEDEFEPGGEPGEIIPFDEAFGPYLPALLAGEDIEPVVSNESYGWLMSVYLPVKDSAGSCACYVGVDVIMPHLVQNEQIFLTRVISLFVGFFLLVLALGADAADRKLIRPINAMAEATASFVSRGESGGERALKPLQELPIRTGDEIENLYNSIRRTTEETVQYFDEINSKNEHISHLQNGLILVLADLVESRDTCTGNHVRNTAAYVRIIMDKMRELGIYADQLSSDYEEEVVSSAPLHDVGKIQVPDALLNKPGRLTDEEFSKMKEHTVRGGEIIDRAIHMVDEDSSGYLIEARKLTVAHHERWDGKGYPNGLKGEEIPLSARVMAVADVFDALVSKRSYKEGFPVEKAIDIIRSEAGTHFDPKVVEAFLQCGDQVRAVAEDQGSEGAFL
ncbi:MAG: HD domain-containing protein [Oscillospiraceae bacterium]|nr:HD domain-containing protein [Oscillospiraceae bacterium]